MPKYYPINEEAAKRAKDMNSFSDYQPGSDTAGYRAMVDEAYAAAERQKARVDPMYHDKICLLYTSIIYADPPWRYSAKKVQGAAENHYPTMSTVSYTHLDVYKRQAIWQSMQRNSTAETAVKSILRSRRSGMSAGGKNKGLKEISLK